MTVLGQCKYIFVILEVVATKALTVDRKGFFVACLDHEQDGEVGAIPDHQRVQTSAQTESMFVASSL